MQLASCTLLFLPLCLPVSELQQPESEIWDEGPRPQGEQIDNPDVAGFRANRTRLGFSWPYEADITASRIVCQELNRLVSVGSP